MTWSATHTRISYGDAIRAAGLAVTLAAFDWRIVGTLPLGLDVHGSDIDIVCRFNSSEAFCESLWNAFSACERFSLRQWTDGGRSVVCDFIASGWPFQLFGDHTQISDQAAWRHYEVERRLLELGGVRLRRSVMERRGRGDKTEAAFAAVLHLDGDPYAAMLELFDASDGALAGLVGRALQR